MSYIFFRIGVDNIKNISKGSIVTNNYNKKYRSEWKYLIRTQDMNVLKKNLDSLMELDSHTPATGRYIIHSLYFDNYTNESLLHNQAGTSKKYKWRIRYYGDDLSYIVLEKKEKQDGLGYKKSCKITLDEYKDIFFGNITDLAYDSDKPLIKELAADMLAKGFHPEVIIDYERIAYVEEITNVRITFDLKISASYDLDEFLTGEYERFYIMPSDINLLEVKFDYILPSHIKMVLNLDKINQTSFSKYYFGRKIIDRYIR